MWKYIEEINWAERSQGSRGYEDAKRYILENFKPKRIKEIDNFVRDRHNELYDRINKYEQENDTRAGKYGGDDSFGDMIHHVIGLGEEYFNAVMEDPSILNDLDFVESFSYCIPFEDEYELLDDSYHQGRAKHALQELVRIMTENDPSNDDMQVIADLVLRFTHMLKGDYAKATKGVNRKTYNKFYDFEANDNHAMFANYLSDCKQYMV